MFLKLTNLVELELINCYEIGTVENDVYLFFVKCLFDTNNYTLEEIEDIIIKNFNGTFSVSSNQYEDFTLYNIIEDRCGGEDYISVSFKQKK